MWETVCRAAERWQRRKYLYQIRRAFARSGFPVDHVDDRTIEAALTFGGTRRIDEVLLTAKTLYLAERRLSNIQTGGGKRNENGSDHLHYRTRP